MSVRETLLRQLDTTKPDWFVVFANQQELSDCVRSCTDGHSGTVQAKNNLRNAVFARLWEPMRIGANVFMKEQVETTI